MMLQKDEVRSGLPWDVPIASTHFLWIFFLQLNSTLMQPNEEALVDS
jgi:hypothetical protein